MIKFISKIFKKPDINVDQLSVEQKFDKLLKDKNISLESGYELVSNRQTTIQSERAKLLDSQANNIVTELLKQYPNEVVTDMLSHLDLMANNECIKLNSMSKKEDLMKYYNRGNGNTILDNKKIGELFEIKEKTKYLFKIFEEYAYVFEKIENQLKEDFLKSDYNNDEKYQSIHSDALSCIAKKRTQLLESCASCMNLHVTVTELYKDNQQFEKEMKDKRKISMK